MLRKRSFTVLLLLNWSKKILEILVSVLRSWLSFFSLLVPAFVLFHSWVTFLSCLHMYDFYFWLIRIFTCLICIKNNGWSLGQNLWLVIILILSPARTLGFPFHTSSSPCHLLKALLCTRWLKVKPKSDSFFVSLLTALSTPPAPSFPLSKSSASTLASTINTVHSNTDLLHC